MASYTRRSSRAITTVPSLYQTFQSGETQIPLQTVPSQPAETAASFPALPKQAAAAAQPEAASNLKEEPVSDETETETKLKRSKVPKVIKKQRRNKLLSRIIQPKPALMLLNEIKPGLSFQVKEPPVASGGIFEAQAVFEGRVLGTGHGTSKNASKHKAAELALKQIIKETVADPSFLATISSMETSQDGAMETDATEEEADTPYEKLPWASLASFALHRMFAEWKEDGVEIPTPTVKPAVQSNGENAALSVITSDDIKLPENANSMHPVSLLNQMHAGIKAEELQRTNAPNSSVTVGYRINGQLYTGTATNGKAARKIAATHACISVYGVTFT